MTQTQSLPTVAFIEAVALRCIGADMSQTAERFQNAIGMSPARFAAEVEGGHGNTLAEKLAARFSGDIGASMLADFDALAANSAMSGKVEPIQTEGKPRFSIRLASDNGDIKQVFIVYQDKEYLLPESKWLEFSDAAGWTCREHIDDKKSTTLFGKMFPKLRMKHILTSAFYQFRNEAYLLSEFRVVDLFGGPAIGEVLDTNQQMKNTTKRNTTLVFLRYERAAVSTIGILNLKTSLESEADVKKALREATTHWVNTTKEGRDLWNYSCADLNIGDLAGGNAFESKEFLDALRQRGIEYVDCHTGGCESALSYDEILVNESDLLEQNAEAPQG